MRGPLRGACWSSWASTAPRTRKESSTRLLTIQARPELQPADDAGEKSPQTRRAGRQAPQAGCHQPHQPVMSQKLWFETVGTVSSPGISLHISENWVWAVDAAPAQ